MPQVDATDRRPLIGVLALQGAFREHVRALEACGARVREVRLEADLEGLAGIVIPGGESTTITMLLERMGLFDPLAAAVAGGLPTFGTCAGMILLSSRIADGRRGQRTFGLLDVTLRRNGYGAQLDSFEAALEVEGIEGGGFPGVFIRAPVVESVGPRTGVIASHGGHPVAVRQDRILALCFHPELSGDLRLHRAFVEQVSEQAAASVPTPAGGPDRSPGRSAC